MPSIDRKETLLDTKTPGATENLWNSQDAEGLSELEALAYRSNL
jgi:hypothetical protein